MGVKADDIILFEMTFKFYYKNFEVTVRKINNIVDIGIMGISEKGYILDKHKTIIINQDKFNRGLLLFIRAKIRYIEKMYNDLVEEGSRNDDKIEEFG